MVGCENGESGDKDKDISDDDDTGADDDYDYDDDFDDDDSHAPTVMPWDCSGNIDGQTVGLFTYKLETSQGYTLFAPLSSKTTYLIDICGREVHSWKSAYPPGHAAYLLEDGSLIRTAVVSPSQNPTFNAGGAGGRVERFDWEGNLIWEFDYADPSHVTHHDIEVLPNGNILMIAWEKKSWDQVIANGRDPGLMVGDSLWVDYIIEVEPTGASGGNIVWEWRLWDHMIQDFDPTKANYGVVNQHPELIDINFSRGGKTDWTHSNSVDYNPDFDQIMISVLGFCELWIIDHGTTTAQAADHAGGARGKGGDLLYRWGNPQTYGVGNVTDQAYFYQHDAHWITEGLPGQGAILAFNNGETRPEGDFSSIDQIIPPVDIDGNYSYTAGTPYAPLSTEWTFFATPPQSMFSVAISGAQRLPNGNTLICVGNYGAFIEVTKEGKIVWEYINPVVNDSPLTQGDPVPENSSGTQNSVFRAYRYSFDYPGFDGRDLTPGDYIELYE